jgi:hypothetical protein
LSLLTVVIRPAHDVLFSVLVPVVPRRVAHPRADRENVAWERVWREQRIGHAHPVAAVEPDRVSKEVNYRAFVKAYYTF